MSRRVGVDAPAPPRVAGGEERGAVGANLLVGPVEVRDADVEVELLIGLPRGS